MSNITDVQLINWALGEIPAEGITARTDKSESAIAANRLYDIILQLCLRRGTTPWNFATKRISLTPTNNAPVNEFAKEYELPGDLLAIQMLWPKGVPYRKEGGKLYTNSSTIILKYTSNEVLKKTYLMEWDFAQYFMYSLAAAMTPSLSEDQAKTNDLKKKAEEAYVHASAAFSMEDTPDEMPESIYIRAHEGYAGGWNHNQFDFDSLPG